MKFNDMSYEDKIKWAVREIKNRFTANGFKPITLTMRENQDTLTLSAYKNDMGDPSVHDVNEIELIKVEGGTAGIQDTYEDIEDLADKLINYKKVLYQDRRQKTTNR